MNLPTASSALLALTLGGWFVAGCQDDGCDVALEELSMVATVVDNGPFVRAEVDFATGPRGGLSIPYQRCPGESIRINGSEARETVKTARFEYSLTVPAEAASRAFQFEFIRGDRPPVMAEVVLPPAFVVTSPASGSLLLQSSETEVTWEPAAPQDEMRILVFEEIGEGICLHSPLPDHDYKSNIGVRIPDEGRWIIPSGALVSPDGRACDAFLQFNRYSYGAYPEQLSPEGFVEGRVMREIQVSSSP